MDSKDNLEERFEHVETTLKELVLQLEMKLRRTRLLCFVLTVILAVVAATSVLISTAQQNQYDQQQKLLFQAQLEARLARESATQKIIKRQAFEALFEKLEKAGSLKVFDGDNPRAVQRNNWRSGRPTSDSR